MRGEVLVDDIVKKIGAVGADYDDAGILGRGWCTGVPALGEAPTRQRERNPRCAGSEESSAQHFTLSLHAQGMRNSTFP